MVGVLKHQPRMRHEAAFAYGAAADGKRPFGLVESRENAGERGFARAVAPDQGRDARRYGKGRVRKDGLFGRIGKGHAVGGEDALRLLRFRNRFPKGNVNGRKRFAGIRDIRPAKTPAGAQGVVSEHFPGP